MPVGNITKKTASRLVEKQMLHTKTENTLLTLLDLLLLMCISHQNENIYILEDHQ